jgi:hypothetical protein
MASKSACAALVLAAGLTAAAAQAEPQKAAPQSKPRQCFFSNEWEGWRPLNEKTIILRVRLHDYYRLDLSHRCPELLSPTARIISFVRGSNTICGPLDLDLRVADDPHFSTPCIVSSMTKLTSEEVSHIPKKSLP